MVRTPWDQTLVTTIPGPPETVTGAAETVKETDVPGAVLARAREAGSRPNEHPVRFAAHTSSTHSPTSRVMKRTWHVSAAAA
jgi:hypothetical protein